MKKMFMISIVLLAFGVLAGAVPSKAWGDEAKAQAKVLYWYCPMHTSVHKDGPGNCPICSMTLVPKYAATAPAAAAPTATVPQDGAMKGLAPVQLDAFKRQALGVKLVAVRKASVTRLIRTVGRIAGGAGDFAALAGDFAAHAADRPSSRFVVADVYALDQPFLKVGQMARVSSLSASGAKAEGKLVQLYPYDGTLSRVRRVRLQVKGLFTGEDYVNVEIVASTPPRLSVPREAVLTTGTHDYVFVETGEGRFTPQEVTVGFLGDLDCEIVSGLKEGEKVAAGGNFLLDADSRITAGAGE